MGESWGKGTICVQGGYTPKMVNHVFYHFIKVQHINTILQMI